MAVNCGLKNDRWCLSFDRLRMTIYRHLASCFDRLSMTSIWGNTLKDWIWLRASTGLSMTMIRRMRPAAWMINYLKKDVMLSPVEARHLFCTGLKNNPIRRCAWEKHCFIITKRIIYKRKCNVTRSDVFRDTFADAHYYSW